MQAFRQRLTEDYVKAAGILNRICDHRVIAYLYPYSDTGAGAGADPLAADINRLGVETNYLLAFTRAGNPFNGPQSDRYNLTRLRVQGDWDGQRLVSELAKYTPRQEALTAIGNRETWQLVNGPQLENGVIRMPMDSLAWVRGTDNWSDVDVKARLHLTPGAQTAVYVRYAGPQTYLRLTVADQELSLQERLGSVMQTLVRQPVKQSGDQSFTLQFKVQGNRAWVWFNNAPLIRSAPLTSITRMGSVGVGAQNGQVQVENFAAAPLPDVVALARGYDQLPADLQGKTRVIIPAWFSLSSSPVVDLARRNEVLLAAAAGVETIPAVAPGMPVAWPWTGGPQIWLRPSTLLTLNPW